MSVAGKIALVTAILGFILGFWGQRSRMCFIGGWRDFFLIRDTYLLKGFIAFAVTAAIVFFVCSNAGLYVKNYPWFQKQTAMQIDIAGTALIFPDQCDLTFFEAVASADSGIKGLKIGNTVIPNESLIMYVAAFFLGLLSTLANGCPLRQHVMAGSGNISSWVYMVGFYGGIIAYNSFIHNWLNRLIN